MADDFAFGSSTPAADLFGRGLDTVMRERVAQRFGDVTTIFDDRAADVENHQPDRRLAARSQDDRRDGCGCRETLQRLSSRKSHIMSMRRRVTGLPRTSFRARASPWS